MCIRACDQQGIHCYKFDERKLPVADYTNCIFCGQCVQQCPSGALKASPIQMQVFEEAMKNKNLNIVCLIAPVTRHSIGSYFDLDSSIDYSGSLIKVLKQFGVYKVYDINWGADSTTCIDTNELLKMKQQGKVVTTSCCPAFIRQMEVKHPQVAKNHASTAKSCVLMLANAVRHINKDQNLFIVEIMPCVAKSYEMRLDNSVNCSITVKQFGEYLKKNGITADNFKTYEEDKKNFNYDFPFCSVSGSSYRFGFSSGVSLSVICDLAYRLTGNSENYTELPNEEFEGFKVHVYKIKDQIFKAIIVSGGVDCEKVEQLIEKGLLDGKIDIVEGMSCPSIKNNSEYGGCINGGGNPKIIKNRAEERLQGMKQNYNLSQYKSCQENETLLEKYEKTEFFERDYDDF